MKKCPKCGLDNIDSATKCLFCDTPFDESTIHNDEDLNFLTIAFKLKVMKNLLKLKLLKKKEMIVKLLKQKMILTKS